MELATGNYSTGQVAPSGGNDESMPPINACQTNENESCSLSENNSRQSQEHLQIVARATNDAVRDWDVRSGALVWPQGLAGLLGYCRSSIPTPIGFWQQHIHPEDVARVMANIGAALVG